MANVHIEGGSDTKKDVSAFYEAQASFADRTNTPAAEAYLAAQSKLKARQRAASEKRGKLLTYKRCDEGMQRLLDTSRTKSGATT